MKTLKTELKDFGRTAVCELKSVWKRKCCFLFQTHQNEVINRETTVKPERSKEKVYLDCRSFLLV